MPKDLPGRQTGIWPFTEQYEAQCSRFNRPRGTICTRNIDTVNRDQYKTYLLKHVIPPLNLSGRKVSVVD